MTIGKQLIRNLDVSNVGIMKHKEFQENIKIFQQNHRVQEYQDYQRELKLMVKRSGY